MSQGLIRRLTVLSQYEEALVKINAITAASEAACLILSVDETIKSPRSGGHDMPAPMPGRGRGRPMM